MTTNPDQHPDDGQVIHFGQVANIRLKPLLNHDYSRKYQYDPETGLFVRVSETDPTDQSMASESGEA